MRPLQKQIPLVKLTPEKCQVFRKIKIVGPNLCTIATPSSIVKNFLSKSRQKAAQSAGRGDTCTRLRYALKNNNRQTPPAIAKASLPASDAQPHPAFSVP
jgi:hypothetical protein